MFPHNGEKGNKFNLYPQWRKKTPAKKIGSSMIPVFLFMLIKASIAF